ncbi:MAG: hypothetical protein JO255_06925 [Alphaproteobacteria bacterium]|nr:hypothetical protein [Alphaproteobacteria bacterium]
MQDRSLMILSRGHRPLWLALLVAASIATSLGFACAVPLAAFAAAAALTLSRRDAVLLVGAVWLANQIVGFAFLDYPWTANCIEWGVALGAIALLSTVAARGAALRLEGMGPVAAPVASFLAAFVVYEGALFVVAATLLGGIEDFTPAIIGRIFAINAIAMAALLVAHRLGAAIGLVAPSTARLRHA